MRIFFSEMFFRLRRGTHVFFLNENMRTTSSQSPQGGAPTTSHASRGSSSRVAASAHPHMSLTLSFHVHAKHFLLPYLSVHATHLSSYFFPQESPHLTLLYLSPRTAGQRHCRLRTTTPWPCTTAHSPTSTPTSVSSSDAESHMQHQLHVEFITRARVVTALRVMPCAGVGTCEALRYAHM
jgi:hypothetical protein